MMDEVRPGDTIHAWFSCGAASAVMLKILVERFGDTCSVLALNNPIAEEHEDNRRFLHDVERWLGVKIQFVTNRKFPNASAVEVWDKESYMNGVNGAPCTRALKKRARQQFEETNAATYLALGFTAEENNRYDMFIMTERSNLLPVLHDAKLTKDDCLRIVQEAGIELPWSYRMGFANANCVGCSKAEGVEYWQLVKRVAPETFALRCEQSRRIGAKLLKYKGVRMFLDELTDDMRGRPIKSFKSVDCGIFCETPAKPLRNSSLVTQGLA